MSHLLENLHNSANHYFPITSTGYYKIVHGQKSPFKVWDMTTDFNVTKVLFNIVSDPHCNLTFKELQLLIFGVVSKNIQRLF